MFTDKLNKLKDERKLTNQQISDLSGVPLSTVTRILNGQTDNPNFQTIIDIVTAMGGSLDELTGLSNSEKTKETENELISCYKGIIEIKNKYIKFLVALLSSILIALMILVVVDIMCRSIGYIR